MYHPYSLCREYHGVYHGVRDGAPTTHHAVGGVLVGVLLSTYPCSKWCVSSGVLVVVC